LPDEEFVAKYGWVKDLPDPRDHPYLPPPEITHKLPKRADLRPYFPEVYNQGNINSCTANAIAAAIEFDEIKQKIDPPFVPSRLFIYYNERAMEGHVDSDSGAQIRNGIKSVSKIGACKEKLWRYLENNLKIKPPERCFRQALRYESVEYQKLEHNLVHLKSCLASGFPFVFGIKVYSSFQSQRLRSTGHLEMPRQHEKFVGKHAVIAVGYDEGRKWFVARNSWGERWGMKGYFSLPYEYLLTRRLSADFWTIRLIR
jgi:C1A family cysteine protease